MTSAEPCASRPGPSLRVLLVEDNDPARRALAKHLELEGFDVTALASGGEALEALRQGPPFDFVLLDLLLPDMDGRDVVRQSQQQTPQPRIALITGLDVENELAPEDRDAVEWVFTKPMHAHELIEALQQAPPPQAE